MAPVVSPSVPSAAAFIPPLTVHIRATHRHLLPPGVVSPVIVPALARLLASHPAPSLVSFLLEGFSFGFYIGVHGPISSGSSPNLWSAQSHPQAVSAAIHKEVARGHSHGPFPVPPFAQYHASPIGLVDKKGGSHRLILDLSNAHAGSVNEAIDFGYLLLL